MEDRLGVFWRVLQHRYYIDDFYMNAIVLPVRDRASAAVYWFNQNVLDGIVNGAAVVAYWFSGVIMWIDRNVIDGAVNGAGTAMETFGKGPAHAPVGQGAVVRGRPVRGRDRVDRLHRQVRNEGTR